MSNFRFLIASTLVAGLMPLTLSVVSLLPSGQAAAQAPPQAAIGIDADPTGNTATLLGNSDSCVSVSKGGTVEVDVTVKDVSDLLAWEAYLSFDSHRLHVVDRDIQQLLSSIPESNAFDISESVPDDDGRYRVGAANITDPPQGASGSGVLARLSLEAVESGLVVLSLAPIETNVGNVGITLTDVDGSQIGDSDGDSLFDGPVRDAQVAIDEPCPGDDGSAGVAAAIGGDGGLAWWVFAATAFGAVAVLGFGGAVLMARRRPGAG